VLADQQDLHRACVRDRADQAHGGPAGGEQAARHLTRSIDFHDDFPRTSTGKLVKRELRDPYWQAKDSALVWQDTIECARHLHI